MDGGPWTFGGLLHDCVGSGSYLSRVELDPNVEYIDIGNQSAQLRYILESYSCSVHEMNTEYSVGRPEHTSCLSCITENWWPQLLLCSTFILWELLLNVVLVILLALIGQGGPCWLTSGLRMSVMTHIFTQRLFSIYLIQAFTLTVDVNASSHASTYYPTLAPWLIAWLNMQMTFFVIFHPVEKAENLQLFNLGNFGKFIIKTYTIYRVLCIHSSNLNAHYYRCLKWLT